jgi:PTH1 family peptidyl-tRNA hydrolase
VGGFERAPTAFVALSALRLVAGLGNPGAEYQATRHNAGFMLVDRLAAGAGVDWRREKFFFAEVAEFQRGGIRWLLAKPQTYMNLSGDCVGQMVRFFRIRLSELLVVVDDADLPVGTIRLKAEGSSGGHHGLDSVEASLGGRNYARLKIGVARPNDGARNIAGHVLGRFGAEEREILELVLGRAADQVDCWGSDGVAKAMNRFNGAVKPPQEV